MAASYIKYHLFEWVVHRCWTRALSAFIAILLNEVRIKLFKRLAQSLIFLPYFISWLVVSLMVFAFFKKYKMKDYEQTY